MRTVFNSTLLDIAKQDSRVHMVLADIGYGEIEAFAQMFPDRYVNVGVAEQNMTGIACGLALEGKIAVTYSIANFPTLRCLEQIRNDVCYHKAQVKIVIIGGGMAYGALGVSHQSTEDIAIMRALPDMAVLSPADRHEAKAAVYAMMAHNGPVYYRCGYKNEPDIHSGEVEISLGKALPVRTGSDAVIVTTGTIAFRGLQAADLLKKEGIHVGLISMPSVKPIDQLALIEAAGKYKAMITLEEHNICGGLGSAVAEVLCDNNIGIPFKRIALPDSYIHEVGSQNWLLDRYGFSPENIAEQVKKLI